MDSDSIKQIVSSISKPEILRLGDEHQVALLPEGMSVHDLSKLLPPAARIKQRATLTNVESFLAYVKRFKSKDSTIFAYEIDGRYEAILDYHNQGDEAEKASRGNCEHVASYHCPKSEQWNAWIGSNGKWMEQVPFAQFIESNLREITEPSGGAMLQIALQLQVHKAAEFESEVRLENGQNKFRYVEQIRGTTKAGDLEIPTGMKLQLPVFVDGARHHLDARFRYRMTEGKLALSYELIRPSEVWAEAIKAVTKEIRDGADGVFVYVGTVRQ